MAMFETVSGGFRAAKNALQGKREITEENIDQALKDIRMSLFQADVNYRVAKDFIARVKEKALGEVVHVKVAHQGEKHKVSPGDVFIKICHDELEQLMGPEAEPLVFNEPKDGPTRIMLVGLQGAGKTTTAGKLARWMLHHHERKPLLVAADVYRPAAIQQLKVLGETLDVPVYSEGAGNPPDLCKEAVREAVRTNRDVVIFDTAGRLAVDDLLMGELEEIVAATQPNYIYLVCDAMIGQDAVNTANEFNQRLDLAGFIMTKLDGDARGGAALSIKEVTGKPITFVGLGEQLDNLQEFRPDGMASRILGFGDIIGMVDRMENVVSQRELEEREKDAERMLRGDFDFFDFLEQVKTIRKMGSLTDLLAMMPFGDKLPQGFKVDETEFVRIESLIHSMTPDERRQPELLKGSLSRQRRVARGSGRTEEDMSGLLQRFAAMKEMLKALGQGSTGFLNKIPGFKQLGQLKQMKDMNLDQLFGDMGGMGDLGAAGPPDLSQMLANSGVPRGFTPPGRSGSAAPKSTRQSNKDRNKRKAKRKQQRKARRRK